MHACFDAATTERASNIIEHVREHDLHAVSTRERTSRHGLVLSPRIVHHHVHYTETTLAPLVPKSSPQSLRNLAIRAPLLSRLAASTRQATNAAMMIATTTQPTINGARPVNLHLCWSSSSLIPSAHVDETTSRARDLRVFRLLSRLPCCIQETLPVPSVGGDGLAGEGSDTDGDASGERVWKAKEGEVNVRTSAGVGAGGNVWLPRSTSKSLLTAPVWVSTGLVVPSKTETDSAAASMVHRASMRRVPAVHRDRHKVHSGHPT